MTYFYLLFPLFVWFVSQTIKFCIRVGQRKVPARLKNVLWIYLWAGGLPSSHTAVLTSSLLLVWKAYGVSPILTFSIVITLLWLYDMYSDRKRQEIMDGYLEKDPSKTSKEILHEGYMLDMAGHTGTEIFWGAVLGIFLGALACLLVLP